MKDRKTPLRCISPVERVVYITTDGATVVNEHEAIQRQALLDFAADYTGRECFVTCNSTDIAVSALNMSQWIGDNMELVQLLVERLIVKN